jgi:hypothetical protein
MGHLYHMILEGVIMKGMYMALFSPSSLLLPSSSSPPLPPSGPPPQPHCPPSASVELPHSVHEDVVVMVRRYEIKLISLSSGHQFMHAKVPNLLHFLNPGCQVMVFKNRWEEEWMMSCNRTCWWRHEHQNFVRKFRGGFKRM